MRKGLPLVFGWPPTGFVEIGPCAMCAGAVPPGPVRNKAFFPPVVCCSLRDTTRCGPHLQLVLHGCFMLLKISKKRTTLRDHR